MNETTRFSFFFCTLAATIAAATLGCSGANGGPSDPNGNVDPLPENTGAISAKLTNIPADVQCVELQTSDYHTSDVRTDVTPGGDATIRIAPLSPGEVYLSGAAYNTPCYLVGYGYGGGGYYGDAGAGSSETWEATPTYIDIQPGQIAETELHFHQLGGADVDVSFDNDTCDPNASFGYGCDGGVPYPPPPADAGVPTPTFDAGAASPTPAH